MWDSRGEVYVFTAKVRLELNKGILRRKLMLNFAEKRELKRKTK